MNTMTVVNELVVANVDDSITFYTSYFRFEVESAEGEPITWAQMKRGDVIFMLQDYDGAKKEINNYPEKTRSCNLLRFEYGNVDEIKTIYATLAQDNVELFMDYTETDYGKSEFGIYDPDKNMIIISAPTR